MIIMLLAGVVLAFYYGWQLALVVLGCGPVLGLSTAFQMKFLKGNQTDSKSALEKSSQVATESLAGIRTVSAFASENVVLDRYKECLLKPYELGVGRAHVRYYFAMRVAFTPETVC